MLTEIISHTSLHCCLHPSAVDYVSSTNAGCLYGIRLHAVARHLHCIVTVLFPTCSLPLPPPPSLIVEVGTPSRCTAVVLVLPAKACKAKDSFVLRSCSVYTTCTTGMFVTDVCCGLLSTLKLCGMMHIHLLSNLSLITQFRCLVQVIQALQRVLVKFPAPSDASQQTKQHQLAAQQPQHSLFHQRCCWPHSSSVHLAALQMLATREKLVHIEMADVATQQTTKQSKQQSKLQPSGYAQSASHAVIDSFA